MTSVDSSTSSTHAPAPRQVLPAQRTPCDTSTAPIPVVPPALPSSALRRLLGGVRAWMVVLPIDAVLLAAPGLWMPEQARAHVVTAVLGLVLLTGGTRYRARLHLS